jgi:hypothetical protein
MQHTPTSAGPGKGYTQLIEKPRYCILRQNRDGKRGGRAVQFEEGVCIDKGEKRRR